MSPTLAKLVECMVAGLVECVVAGLVECVLLEVGEVSSYVMSLSGDDIYCKLSE